MCRFKTSYFWEDTLPFILMFIISVALITLIGSLVLYHGEKRGQEFQTQCEDLNGVVIDDYCIEVLLTK